MVNFRGFPTNINGINQDLLPTNYSLPAQPQGAYGGQLPGFSGYPQQLSPLSLNTPFASQYDAFANDYYSNGQFNPGSNFINYPQPTAPLTLETVFPQSTISNSQPITTQSAFNTLNDLNSINLSALGIAQQSALQQAQAAYLDALLEAQAQQKLLQMNNQSTQANAILDQQSLALKVNQGILSKQTEQYLMDAELREKFTNLFFNLEKTILDNTFQRAKTIVQSAKY